MCRHLRKYDLPAEKEIEWSAFRKTTEGIPVSVEDWFNSI